MTPPKRQKRWMVDGGSVPAVRFNSGEMMSLLFDPKAFNYLIMVLYALNAARWAYDGKWADVSYWLCALGITATVTFGYSH